MGQGGQRAGYEDAMGMRKALGGVHTYFTK